MDEWAKTYVKSTTHELLKELVRKVDTYDEIIRDIVSRGRGRRELQRGHERGDLRLPQPRGRRSQPGGTGVVDVGDALGRVVIKFSAAVGYQGGGFRDWGVSNVARARIATFLCIQDGFTLNSVVATEALRNLTEHHGVSRLEDRLGRLSR